jgi:hypothetical protein
MIDIHNGVIFHQSETNHRSSFYPNQPLPNDAPAEVQIAAAELWTPEFVAEWVAQRNPAPTLEGAIAAKVAEIKAYYEPLDSEMTYEGQVFQIDSGSVLNINSTFLALTGGLIQPPPGWRTKDNAWVQFTAAEFAAFAGAVMGHKSAVFAQRTGHLDAVRALTTVAEVEAYDYGQ